MIFKFFVLLFRSIEHPLYIKLARYSMLGIRVFSTRRCFYEHHYSVNVSGAAQEAVATAEAPNLRSATCCRTRRCFLRDLLRDMKLRLRFFLIRVFLNGCAEFEFRDLAPVFSYPIFS